MKFVSGLEAENDSFSLQDQSSSKCDNTHAASRLIQELIRVGDVGETDHPFFVCNVKLIEEVFRQWSTKFPFAQCIFDVSNNGNPEILRLLSTLGCHFFCQNREELRAVLDAGVGPEKVTFSARTAVSSHIKFAIANKVEQFLFENQRDLNKLGTLLDDGCKLMMTIHTSSMTDVTHYGALLQQATDLGLKVVGASIMNDDDNQSLSVSDMLPMSEILFQVGKQHGQEEMEVLNMGSVLNLEAQAINKNAFLESQKIRKFFGNPSEELLKGSFLLVSRVLGKRQWLDNDDTQRCCYVINDGIYGSFGELMYNDTMHISPVPIQDEPDNTCPTAFWGPSGDELDVLPGHFDLPDLQVGDPILFKNMGNRTMSAGIKYQLFEAPDVWNSDEFHFWIFFKGQEDQVPSLGRSASPDARPTNSFGFEDLLPEMTSLSF